MHPVFQIPLLAFFLQDPIAKDSAEAVLFAGQLSRAHYEISYPRIGLDTLHWHYPRFREWDPAQRRSEHCISESLDECLGGDWDCQGWLDCTGRKLSARRTWLLDELDLLAPIAGSSDYMFRQRVAFAVKDGDLRRAAAVAESCYGIEWWCMALRGFVANWAKPGSGLAAYDSALATAPREVACAWADYARVRPSAARASRLGACPLADIGVDRFWWMADPLWTKPGNERRAEHLTRLIIDQMEFDLWRWGLCRSELLQKGPPNSVRIISRPLPDSPYEYDALMRGRCRFADRDGMAPSERFFRYYDALKQSEMSRRAVRGVVKPPEHTFHERFVHGGYSFTPDSVRMGSPLESEAEDWAVEWNEGDERMVTRERWYNLEQQTAVFWRNGRLLVVAAAAVPPQLATVNPSRGGLALGRIDDLTVLSTPGGRDNQGAFRASMEVDSGAYLASIELVSDSVIGRARLGAPAPKLDGKFGISDLAMVDPRFESDQIPLTQALLPSTMLTSDKDVGIYFEVYGVDSDEQLSVELSGVPMGKPGVISRALRFLRLKSRESAVSIAWQERANIDAQSVFRRFVRIDVSQLSQGEHDLTLTITRANGTKTTSMRSVRILP